MIHAKIGAVLSGLWGLLHIAGVGAILVGLGDSTAAGYAFYRNTGGPYPPVTGAILGFNSFAILWVGVLVVIVAARLNWRNDRSGIHANIALAGLSDLGLVVFLLIPGFVSLGDAALGIVLFLLAAAFALLGRRAKPAVVPV